jgi:hypothetical protein
VSGAEPAAVAPAVDVTVLHAKIGELTLLNDFWPVRSGAKPARDAGHPAQVDRSVAEQGDDWPGLCVAGGPSGTAAWDQPRAVPAADLAIMRRIDELHLLAPFAGSRMLRDPLRQEGVEIGRLHVATLMKRMRIEAIYRRPNTSKPAPGHKVYPTCCVRWR